MHPPGDPIAHSPGDLFVHQSTEYSCIYLVTFIYVSSDPFANYPAVHLSAHLVVESLTFFLNFIVPMEFLPWEIRVAFPGESQLRQIRATQPKVYAGCFSVSIIAEP